MKILQVGLGGNPGGIEAFVMNYFRELAMEGISFDFVSMYGKIAYEEEILGLGGRVFYVPNVKKDYRGYVREMKDLLRRESYDVIHVNMLSAANLLPLKLGKRYGAGLVIAHSHNASAPGIVRRAMDLWNKPFLRCMDVKKVACGEMAGRWMFGEKAFKRGEITIISNAIDVEKYGYSQENRERIRCELGISKEDFVIGHVGRFQVQKNHQGLLDIFQEAAKEEPCAKLLLVGEGELMEEIRKKAEACGLGDRVVFSGVRRDVEAVLSAMDVFLFPSLFEGLPFTLLEAQANGLPCVISDRVTQEGIVNRERVRQLDLKAKKSLWVKEVLSFRGQEREERAVLRRRLIQAGFDIKKEAGRLLRIYEESLL